MTDLPDLRELVALPFDAQTEVTGIAQLAIPKNAQRRFDTEGLFWAAPFASGSSGSDYAFRLTPGPGHGAVLRCVAGHAVTIASSPDRAILAIVACERLVRSDKFRSRLHAGWSKNSKARKLLRSAVTITGGNPDELDDAIHRVDGMADVIERRREVLRLITSKATSTNVAWARSDASIRAPKDAKACLELLQGNHGLDGTHGGGGLLPNNDDARELLVACAKKVQASKLEPDPTWAAVIASIAKSGKPRAEDFIKPIGAKPSQESWEALAMSAFWFNAEAEDVDPDLIRLAENMAGKIAKPILEARRALRNAK